MSTLWQKWGAKAAKGQVVGFDCDYYIKDETGALITVYPEEIDDLIFQLMRLKRKAKGKEGE